MEFLGCLSQHVFTYSLFICCASYKNNNITDFFPTAYCKSIHTNISSHSYLSVSLMKGIVLFFELCFSLLQSANWIRNKVHIMKTGTGLEPILLKILKDYSMRVENPMFLHVMSLSMIQLSAAVISQSQKRAAMHQQNPPECHQRTGGRCTHSSEYPTSSPKGILFAFPLLKIIMKLIKIKKSSSLWMCISCMLSSSVG